MNEATSPQRYGDHPRDDPRENFHSPAERKNFGAHAKSLSDKMNRPRVSSQEISEAEEDQNRLATAVLENRTRLKRGMDKLLITSSLAARTEEKAKKR